jgi:osomolarity two-component system sensor histidine kinase SLN1
MTSWLGLLVRFFAVHHRVSILTLCTGNALQSDQDDYLEAGADYVLTKPVLEKNLRGMLVLAQERKAAFAAADDHMTTD